MNNHDQENRQQPNKSVARVLHPAVYVALVGLTAWLALAIWGFGYDGQTDYLLAIVTGFLFGVSSFLVSSGFFSSSTDSSKLIWPGAFS